MADAAIDIGIRLPRNRIGARITARAGDFVQLVGVMMRSARRRHHHPEQRHHPPRRAAFMEDAAMHREMLRL
jgi:hypothetical protein